ncbi:MAG: hypothetical protein EBZ47_02765 [Chlamydiae bacterium]|nr:hypothetical protein [Chlamydiota bacterium]
MLSLIFAVTSAFIAIRQCLIISYYRVSFFSVSVILCFSLVATLVTPSALKSLNLRNFFVLAAFFSLWLLIDLYRLKKQQLKFSIFRTLLGICFLMISVIFISSVALPHLHSAKPILKIETTAEEKQEVVTWKNPSSTITSAILPSYRVIIKDMKDHILFDQYLHGDLACIRLKIVQFPTWMQALGFPNLWGADAVSSDYLSAEKHGQFPRDIHPFSIHTRSPFTKYFWTCWKHTFTQGTAPFFIKSCFLESCYIPLADEQGHGIGEYYEISLQYEPSTPLLQRLHKKGEAIKKGGSL